jgi:hypothetical protein
MGKSGGLIWELFFIILIVVVCFIAHNKITDSDHYDCSKEVESKINQVLSYQKQIWEIPLPASLKWIDLSKFKIDLSQIKVSDIQMEWLTTKFEKMRYSWLTRIYDASVEIKLKYPELRDFKLSIPITCTSSSSETTIEYRDIKK